MELVQESVALAKLIIIWTARQTLVLLVMLDNIHSSVQLNVWIALMKIAIFVLALVLTSAHLAPGIPILIRKPRHVQVAGKAIVLKKALLLPLHVWVNFSLRSNIDFE